MSTTHINTCIERDALSAWRSPSDLCYIDTRHNDNSVLALSHTKYAHMHTTQHKPSPETVVQHMQALVLGREVERVPIVARGTALAKRTRQPLAPVQAELHEGHTQRLVCFQGELAQPVTQLSRTHFWLCYQPSSLLRAAGCVAACTTNTSCCAAGCAAAVPGSGAWWVESEQGACWRAAAGRA